MCLWTISYTVCMTAAFDQVEERIRCSDGIFLRVDVTQPWETVEKQIDSCVAAIRRRADELQVGNGWEIYQPDAEEYFKDKEYITVYDDVAFRSNREIYNIIFGQSFKGSLSNVGVQWRKLYTQYGYEEGTVPFFPKLTLENKPTAKGYYNVMTRDGLEIYEHNDNSETNEQRQEEGAYIGQKRVVFVNARNAVTGKREYRFAGVFVGDRYNADGKIVYKRVDDTFKIVRV